MFSKMSIAAFSGIVAINTARIADVAVTILDLGWLVLAALLHVN